ncbi:hypothetical protein [Saccharopolyspora taberi]
MDEQCPVCRRGCPKRSVPWQAIGALVTLVVQVWNVVAGILSN